MPDHERWALGELLHGHITKHEFYATRNTFTPFTVKAQGSILMAMRVGRSPTWNWAEVEESRAEDGSMLYHVQDWVSAACRRTISLQKWQYALVRQLDGGSTALDVFKRKASQTAIPGRDESEKMRAYGALMETLIEQELVLADPS
jgi:hypothetical protein